MERPQNFRELRKSILNAHGGRKVQKENLKVGNEPSKKPSDIRKQRIGLQPGTVIHPVQTLKQPFPNLAATPKRSIIPHHPGQQFSEYYSHLYPCSPKPSDPTFKCITSARKTLSDKSEVFHPPSRKLAFTDNYLTFRNITQPSPTHRPLVSDRLLPKETSLSKIKHLSDAFPSLPTHSHLSPIFFHSELKKDKFYLNKCENYSKIHSVESHTLYKSPITSCGLTTKIFETESNKIKENGLQRMGSRENQELGSSQESDFDAVNFSHAQDQEILELTMTPF